MDIRFYSVSKLKEFKPEFKGYFVNLFKPYNNYQKGLYFGGDEGWELLSNIPQDKSSEIHSASITDDGIIKFYNSFDKTGDVLFELSMQSILENINSELNDRVIDSEKEILKIIEDNEQVVASSLNELNDRVIDNDNTLTEIQTILNDVQTSLSLEYVKDEKKIYLKDKNKQPIGSIDTTDFIKDGMLSDAKLILNQEMDPDYTETIVYPYIKLTFNVDNGGSEDKKEPIRFPVGELFQVYQGGAGISVVKTDTRPEDYKISIKLLPEQSDYINTEGKNNSLSLKVVNTLDNSSTGLASAQSVVSYVDTAIKNVKLSFSTQLEDDERVIASALTDLHKKYLLLSEQYKELQNQYSNLLKSIDNINERLESNVI